MKKSKIAALLLGLTLSTSTSSLVLANKAESTKKGNTIEYKQKIARLHEIKAMDFKNMSRADKKELKKEVLNIKEDLKKDAPYLYISLGAALLIALLLILLL